MDSAKRVISGTWGQAWLDGELVGETYGMQAKISYNKEEISLCGQMGVDSKVKSFKGTGSLRLHKVSSRMARAIGGKIRDGEDVRFTLISKLRDPDSYGCERVVIKNVSFDDLTLADWEANAVGKTECPFTFTDYEYQDEIGVQ